jgi:CubicO group peptidase (beta-lactamase class C family)
MAYEVLGDVIAKASEQTFEASMSEGLFAPLGMAHTTFLRSEVGEDLCTTPHVGHGQPRVSDTYPYHRAHAPSSTLHSSAAEMCAWILACGSESTTGEAGAEVDRILQPPSFEAMWTPHVEARPGRHYGLGWMLSDLPERRWALHGGRDVGFRSHLSVFPDERAGFVILSNYSETPIPPLRDALIEVLFD